MQPMKKKKGPRLFALVLALSMVVTMLVPLSASAAENPLSNFTGAFTEDGGTVTVSNNQGNNYVISDTSVENFILEADMTFLEGNTAGLAFGVSNYGAPGADPICLHVNPTGLRLFRDSDRANLDEPAVAIDKTAPIKLKVEVAGGVIKAYVGGVLKVTKDYEGATGGYVGFCSWNTSAKFENIKFTDTKNPTIDALGKLSGPYFSVDPDTGAVTVNEVPAEIPDKNNHVISNTFSKAFVYEADISFIAGSTGGLTFNYATEENPGGSWCGSCIRGGSEARLFCEGNWSDKENGLDVFLPLPDGTDIKKLHMRLELTPEGVFTVDVDGERVIEKSYPSLTGGYVGFMTWNSSARFENIKFTDNTPPIVPDFKTNIEGWAGQTGVWKATETGYQGAGANNFAAFSTTNAKNFSYSMDLTFPGGGAGGPIFRAKEDHTAYYIATLSRGGTARVLRFTQNTAGQITGERQIGGTYQLPENKETYNIRVETYGPSINLYVDDILAVSGSDDELLEGLFGLNLFNCTATYQNVNYEEKDPSSVSVLTGLKAEGVNLLPAFSTDVYSYKGQVPFSTDKIVLTPTISGDGKITIKDIQAQNGQPCEVPLTVGENVFTISVQDNASGFITSVNFKVKRSQDPAIAYTEKYRNQFHFSEEANWMNDPNGLMYDANTGLYHMYYQYAAGEGTTWGHAISKDLVAWTELPVAIPVDSLGNIWSGCGIVDEKNTSGLFDESTPPASRLVAIYTSQGGDETYGNQKQSLAYSTDYGTTWTKYPGNPVVKNEDNQYGFNFRDPKVQWIEDAAHQNGGFWLMIVAGGRGRIFTSDNLIDWTLNDELVDKNGAAIESECPDFFCLPVGGDPDNLKWVYTGGGTFYVVGDLVKGGDGLYKFQAETTRIQPLYTGGDMYATQSYFNDPKGRRILVSWMVDRFVSQADGKNWQGAQSLPLETTLQYKNGQYLLHSYPVEEVNSVRKDLIFSGTDIHVTPMTENILKDVAAQLCDIEATFTPGTASSFGFNLRMGGGEKLTVTYNTQTDRVAVDRSHTGRTDITTGIYDMALTPMDNGKVKLRILVDTSIIDVFGNDGESSTNCFYYNDPASTGMEFFSADGDVTIDDINIYSMKSTWREMDRPDGPPAGPVAPQAAVMTDISLSDGTLTPAFAAQEKNYTAQVANSVDSIRVKPAFTGEGKASVAGVEVANGAFSSAIALAEGQNTIEVKLVDAGGEETVYTIVVTRLGAGTEPTQPVKPGKPSIPGGSNSGWKWPESTGSATGGKRNPQSGDTSALPAALAVLGSAAAAAVIVSRKKRK